MATIKSYTDIEQSKKLAKILPLESADMWHHGFFNPSRMCKIEYNPPAPYHSVTHQLDCPCWSLAALLGIIRKTIGYALCGVDNYVYMSCDLGNKPWKLETELYDNEVDACYQMIIRLNELNLL